MILSGSSYNGDDECYKKQNIFTYWTTVTKQSWNAIFSVRDSKTNAVDFNFIDQTVYYNYNLVILFKCCLINARIVSTSSLFLYISQFIISWYLSYTFIVYLFFCFCSRFFNWICIKIFTLSLQIVALWSLYLFIMCVSLCVCDS